MLGNLTVPPGKAPPIIVLASQTTYNVIFIEEITAVLTTAVGEAVTVVEAHDENLCRNFEHGHKIGVEAQTCEYGST